MSVICSETTITHHYLKKQQPPVPLWCSPLVSNISVCVCVCVCVNVGLFVCAINIKLGCCINSSSSSSSSSNSNSFEIEFDFCSLPSHTPFWLPLAFFEFHSHLCLPFGL